MTRAVFIIYRKRFDNNENRYENKLLTVFSEYESASNFCQILSKRNHEQKDEYLVAKMIIDKYKIKDSCDSLDLRIHIPFDLNQMEFPVPCIIYRENSIYLCTRHNNTYCSKHITGH